MSFNPNLVVSHEVNKAFQSNNFPRWFYYYNFTDEAMGEDFIPYGEAMAYHYGHNAVFEIIGADSKSLGFKKLEIDHSTRTTKLTSIELENGSSVVVDYNTLANKPKINGNTLNSGNNSAENLGLHSSQLYDHNIRSGYTQVNDTLEGHLDGISSNFLKNTLIDNIISKMKTGQTVKIICYGDSMTYGYTIGSGEQVENPYPAILQKYLRSYFINDNITVINAGTSGWQSDEALNNLSTKVLSQNPDMCITMFGINDMKGSSFGAKRTIDEFQANMDSMLKILNNNNIATCVMSTTPLLLTNTFNNYLISFNCDKINSVIKFLSNKYNMKFIDTNKYIIELYNNLFVDPLIFSRDGIHFIPTGYKYIADAVFDGIIKIQKAEFGKYISATNFTSAIIEPTNGVNWGVDIFYKGYKAQTFYNNILMRTSNSSISSQNIKRVSIFVFNQYKNLKSRVYCPSANSGTANGNIRINDVLYPISFRSRSFGENYIDVELDYGINRIELLSSDSTNDGNSNIFIEGVEFFNPEIKEISSKINNLSIIQEPLEKSYEDNGLSNNFVLPKIPVVITDVWVFQDIGSYYLQKSDYTVNENTVTINNPILSEKDIVKINYTAI